MPETRAHGMYNYMYNRYKAVLYLNGGKLQEMYDFSLPELKQRVQQKTAQVDATGTGTPLTKVVQWTTQPSVWDCKDTAVQIQAAEAKDPVSDCQIQSFPTELPA